MKWKRVFYTLLLVRREGNMEKQMETASFFRQLYRGYYKDPFLHSSQTRSK